MRLRLQLRLRVCLEIRHVIGDAGGALSLVLNLVYALYRVIVFVEHLVLLLLDHMILFSLLVASELALAACRSLDRLHTPRLLVRYHRFLDHLRLLFHRLLLHLAAEYHLFVAVHAAHGLPCGLVRGDLARHVLLIIDEIDGLMAHVGRHVLRITRLPYHLLRLLQHL